VPLGANLAIEHMISKSKAPHLETNWDNFVLACTNCNSTKSTKITLDNYDQVYWPTQVYNFDGHSYNTFDLFKYGLNDDGNAVVVPRHDGDQRAHNTIDMLQLNRVRSNDPKESDRRVWNRTRTWHMATNLAERLAAYYKKFGSNADTDPAVALLKRRIRAAAVAAGFWSVWMTVFMKHTYYNKPTSQQLLCDLFVSSFPGTNYPIGSCTAPTFD
jgi:hypothetical protein